MTISTAANRAAKWLCDRLVPLVLLIILAPVLLAIAVAIRLDSPGPALFWQKRLGRSRRPFRIVKFRTMRYPPEDFRACLDLDDPRITRVGRYLRRLRLDETPQLWNVLIGQMSLVGPRPHVYQEAAEWEQDWPVYAWRYRVRPGITSLAELLAGSLRSRTALNARYAYNWTFVGDIKVLALTGKWLLVSLLRFPKAPLVEEDNEASSPVETLLTDGPQRASAG